MGDVDYASVSGTLIGAGASAVSESLPHAASTNDDAARSETIRFEDRFTSFSIQLFTGMHQRNSGAVVKVNGVGERKAGSR